MFLKLNWNLELVGLYSVFVRVGRLCLGRVSEEVIGRENERRMEGWRMGANIYCSEAAKCSRVMVLIICVCGLESISFSVQSRVVSVGGASEHIYL